MEVAKQSPQRNLQQNLKALIQTGHIIPVKQDSKSHTRVETTVNGKRKILFVDDSGRAYDAKTGREFVLRQ